MPGTRSRVGWRRSISGHAASGWPTATAGARSPPRGAWWSAAGDPARDQAAVVAAIERDRGRHGRGRSAPEPLGRERPGGPGRAERGGGPAPALEPLGITVETADERFTTVEAQRSLTAAGRKGRAARSVIDSAAAMVLLQAWLDAAMSGPERADGEAGGPGERGRGLAARAGVARRPVRQGSGPSTVGRREPRRQRLGGAAFVALIGGRGARGRAGLRLLVRAGVPRARAGRAARGRAGQPRASRWARWSAQLSADHVIGSSLAFRVFDLVHGSPTLAPGALPAAPEPDLRPGARHPGGGTQHLRGHRATRA